MIKKIDHIGIAVQDLAEATSFYRDRLGLSFQGVQKVPERGLEIAFFKAGDVLIELLAPMAADSEIARFLEKRGPGMHHMAFETDGMSAETDGLKGKGVRLLSEKPSIGAEGFPIIFMHPKDSASGVLLELIERKPAQ